MKLLIEGDLSQVIFAMSDRWPGQHVSVVKEGNKYYLGVLDLTDGDDHYFKGPEPIAEETVEEAELSTDQRS